VKDFEPTKVALVAGALAALTGIKMTAPALR
jgi:hypothetical protein